MITRTPTYSNYMNLMNRAMTNKATFNYYNFQSMTGLKSDKYSGYGVNASNIVSFENSLNMTNNFIENNKKLDVEFKTITNALSSIHKFSGDVKKSINSMTNSMQNITPDYTGGEIKFTDNNATYLGETITVNGTTYTFANNNTGNNIDISTLTPGSATYAEDVMTALENKLPANADFKFEDGKFSFPLYTIDGVSSVVNLSGVEKGKPHVPTSEQLSDVKNLQNVAFSALQNLFDNLNSHIDGQYLLGGGVYNKAPVNFPFRTLEEFQKYYDGVNINFPTSSTANLSNLKFDSSKTGNISLELDANNKNTGTITASNPEGFTNKVVSGNPNTTGNLNFDATKNTIKADNANSFDTLTAGDTIVISGGTAGANDKAYVIKSISADGKTITVDDSTPVMADATISPSDDVIFSKTFPVGSVVDMENFGNNISGTVQVTGISDDGKTLYVKTDPSHFPPNGSPLTLTPADNWSMETKSYYNGGDQSSERRISENQSIVFDITAQDPAFEKLFRGLASLCQGNLIDMRDPTQGLTSDINVNKTQDILKEANKLISDATSSDYNSANTKNSDIQTITAKVSNEYVRLNRVVETQEIAAKDIESSIYNLKNVDKEEAAIKSIVAMNNLNASYEILKNALQMSLLNYLR